MTENEKLTPYDRAYGCLLGLAIGDAMGMPTSFLTPSQVREEFGLIEGFRVPPPGHRFHDGLRRGEITDDTEQSLALAKSFLQCHRVDPGSIVKELLEWARRVDGKYASPFGPSTQRALDALMRGAPPDEAGREGDTNGAAMRIAPLGIIHGARGSGIEDIVQDVALACMPTHGTQVAISAASAVASSIAACFRGPIEIAQILEQAENAASLGSRYGHEVVSPSVSKRIAWVAKELGNRRSPAEQAYEFYNFLGAGVFSADSIPVALGIFGVAGGDPSQAILLAANLGGDSDTIAAIAGALGGAFMGPSAIPEDWKETVQKVNQLDLGPIAQSLVDLAPDWKIAEER